MDDLDQLEDLLELDFFTWGWAKAREDDRKSAFADTQAGTTLIEESMAAVTNVIRKEQDQLENGMTRDYGTALLSLEAPKLALLSMRAILNALVEVDEERSGVTVMRVAQRIGAWCWLESTRARQNGSNQRLLDALAKRNKNPYNAKRRAMKILAAFEAEDWEKSGLDVKLGGYLIEAVIIATGLFYRRIPKKPGRQMTLELSDRGIERFEVLVAKQSELIAPRWPPMVRPPTPWNAVEGGGYRHATGLRFVIDRKTPGLADRLDKADLGMAYAAVNAIQETAWRVNRRLWDEFLAAWDSKHPAKTLPSFEYRTLPAKLADDAPKEDQERRKRERIGVHRANREARAHRVEVQMKQVVVGKLRDCALYFPHRLDWRGRTYPIPQFLHPQGDEVSRGVLEFATAKPLGERGVWWLAVHLANCFGKDKLPFPERVAWVREHDAAILQSAERPFEGGMFWAEADKPWRFLAAAREWAGYRQEGPGFRSRVPIAMDGTCNGLQHLSALGRDAVGGRWTNLVPGERPEDIYREVAEQLKRLLEAHAANGWVMAELWLPFVDRKLVKQPTMTTPYGARLKAFQQQIRQRLYETEAGACFPDPWKAAEYLAPIVRDAIGLVVVQATKISRWLQKVAWRLAKKSNAGIAWTSPVGLPVEQRTLVTELSDRVETCAGVLGRRVPVDPLVVDASEQRKGIVPNLIHSLDAAHMMRTVNALHAKGLRDFAMVHDSYAVHACDVDTMNAVLRDEFVKLHEEFTLERWFVGVRAANPSVALPKAPRPGTLDLGAVRESAYFFA
jgi:DNA-directed RNA polymerase